MTVTEMPVPYVVTLIISFQAFIFIIFNYVGVHICVWVCTQVQVPTEAKGIGSLSLLGFLLMQ